jgi:ADP-ribose pyrophosphatase
MTAPHETTLRRTEVFRGKLLTLETLDVVLEDGRSGYREIIRHPGAIGVLARHPDGSFLFVRQYRKAVECLMTEVVAGLLDPGESPEAAAHRELEEETGHRAARLVPLGMVFASPGYVDETIHAYYAEVEAVPTSEARPDHDERIEVIRMDEATFEQAVRAGNIRDAKTLALWTLWRAQGRGTNA